MNSSMNIKSITKNLYVVILAAGDGRRMMSTLPKILHEIGGESLLGHVLATAKALGAAETCVVISPQLEKYFQGDRDFDLAIQQEPLGTGHAVMASMPWLRDKEGEVLILCGDVPFLSNKTLSALRRRKHEKQTPLAILSMTPQDPGRYGRIFCDHDGFVDRIVEYKDLPENERGHDLCNSGMMLADISVLDTLLSQVNNDNASKEYYLTDVVEIGRKEGGAACVLNAPESELLGVNSQQDLAKAEAIFQAQMREMAFEKGVRMPAPDTVYFSYDTSVAARVLIDPYVVFGPGVTLEEGAHIRSFSHVEGSHVKAKAIVGPYARLRPETEIGVGAKIGNFVEIKKTRLADGAKVNHLSYIGDAEVGAKANIGAGTITCNYDGQLKYKTSIGAGAFIGSNVSLVAPVSVGVDAMVAAGSVVTEDVASDALAVARSRQCTIEKGSQKFRQKKKTEKQG